MRLLQPLHVHLSTLFFTLTLLVGPRGLRREDMSPMARMMAVADIFEALTAADRPYKPGKRLSEALHIMARMCREQHIDADVFALFLRAGVYQAYAERYMPPELIDAVQIENYLH